MAWALYVNDVLIPKYWEYEDGIYFTVLDPQFFADHKGKRLRFSQNGMDFYDTGMKLAAPPAAAVSKSKGKVARLPLQGAGPTAPTGAPGTSWGTCCANAAYWVSYGRFRRNW